MPLLGFQAALAAPQPPSAQAETRAVLAAPVTETPLPKLQPIPRPNLSALEDAVREQIEAQQADLQVISQKSDVSREALAEAYGQMGKVYHAYSLFDAAAVCYQNAFAIAPSQYTWPYYLGLLHQEKGDIARAITYLKIAKELRPKEIPISLSLGNAYLADGQADLAKVLFQDALALDPSSVGAMAGLGKAALSKRDFATAISFLQTALKLQPQATELHYHLAMAYRGVGDVTNALAQLRQKGNGKVESHDSLMQDLENLRSGEAILWRRGNLAMVAGRYADAIKYYNQMVDLAKNDPLPRIYLGNALATSGDLKGAIEQYQQVLGALPSNATAYYNLGVVFLENKDEQAAMEQFHAALKADPDFKQAHFQLANLLMRDKQHAEAIAHYTHVIQVSPDNEFARLMKAMALIRLSRYAEAKAELEEGVSALPESADLASTLARLLAACPDKSLRDGPRALRMVETLLRANPSADIELAETYAMALAASDRFSDAVELQKRMLAEVERAKRFDLVAELKKNLGLYERGETCSQPWQDVDPIFSPKPGKMELLGPKADLRMVKGVSISP